MPGEPSHSNQDFAQVLMITWELQASINAWLQRLDAAELIGEGVPVKGDASDAGSHYCRLRIQASCKSAHLPWRFQASGISSPFFFLFLNSNSQCYSKVDTGSPFRIRLRPRDILSRGSPCPTWYHLNPRGMAAITKGVDKVTVAGPGTTTTYVKSPQAWLASHTTQHC